MLRAHTAPPILVKNTKLLAQTWNVLGRTPTADHIVLMPADVSQVGDLIYKTTFPNPAGIEP